MLRLSLSPHRPHFAVRPPTRAYHDYIRFTSQGSSARIPLSSKVIGAASSRGTRSYQEDAYAYTALSLNPEELRASAKNALGVDWDPASAGSVAGQALFVGVYDGHGGAAVSEFLKHELHGIFESVHKDQIPETFAWAREIGGYFKRFDGGAMKPWLHGTEGTPEMDLAARATLTFFTVDKLLGLREDTYTCGATASVALFHSLDSPAQPFYASRKLALTMAHVGDTRAVLCATATGRAHALTETHHADGRTESARLRRTGTAVTADSFGETRFMGALANTRCLGDLRFKPFGVTPEPDMRVRLLDADGAAAGPTSTRAQATTTVIADGGAAFVVLVSDGVSSVVSDAEMCGLAREARSPQAAADAIVAFAEEMGSDDNLTAVVVPLAGWGAVRGPDETAELRSFRRTQMVGSERQRRM